MKNSFLYLALGVSWWEVLTPGVGYGLAKVCKVERTGVTKDPVVVVEVERVAFEVDVLVAWLATVMGSMKVEAVIVLVAAAIPMVDTAVGIEGEEEDAGEEDDETVLLAIAAALAAWNRAARMLSRILLL